MCRIGKDNLPSPAAAAAARAAGTRGQGCADDEWLPLGAGLRGRRRGGARRGGGAAAARSPSPPARSLAARLAPSRRGAAPEPRPRARAAGRARRGRRAPCPRRFGRALIEKLPTPLLVVSRTGRVGYANPAAHEALPRLQPGRAFRPPDPRAGLRRGGDRDARRRRGAAGALRRAPGAGAVLRGAGGPPAAGRRLRAGGAGHRADRGPHRDAALRAAALGLHRQRQPRAPDAAGLDHRLHRDAAEPRAGTIPRRASGSSASWRARRGGCSGWWTT